MAAKLSDIDMVVPGHVVSDEDIGQPQIPVTDNRPLEATHSPIRYAMNANVFLGLCCCPSSLFENTAFLKEWWWRLTSNLMALVSSFWLVYAMYYSHNLVLEHPAYSSWELIPLDSIHRDPALFSCWQPTSCVTRNAYCYVSDYDNCRARFEAEVHQDLWEYHWCEADCSERAVEDHGVCGCMGILNPSDYTNPENGSYCYIPRDEQPSDPLSQCSSHSDCTTNEYCLSCELCEDLEVLSSADLDCGVCDRNSTYNALNSTCANIYGCYETYFVYGLLTSIDRNCPNWPCIEQPFEPSWGSETESWQFSGYQADFCPNYSQDICLDEVTGIVGWTVAASVFAVFFVRFFQQARKSYVRVTSYSSSYQSMSHQEQQDARSDQDYCNAWRCVRVTVVDVMVPFTLTMAAVTLATTRSYPLVVIPEGGVCDDQGVCTELEVAKKTLLAFWAMCWLLTCPFHFLFSIGEFYYRRYKTHKSNSATIQYAVLLDLRQNATYDQVHQGDEDDEEDKAFASVVIAPPTVLDYVLAVVLLVACLTLAVASISYAFPNAIDWEELDIDTPG